VSATAMPVGRIIPSEKEDAAQHQSFCSLLCCKTTLNQYNIREMKAIN
jgi:hypothetical protein